MAAAELARRGFVRRAAKAVLALALLFVANAAYGEGIPRLGDIPTTMDPVQVALWPNLRSKSTAEPWVQFEIPRAYIYLTSHHSQKQLLQLRTTVVDAIADGVLTGAEAEDIREWIARIVGDGYSETGLPSMGMASQFPDMISDHALIEFPRRTFVVTGALRIAPRREIARMILAAEGIFADMVTKQTDYVIVALTASRDWRTTHFGTKIERARELINQGSNLRLVAEHAFEAAISARRT